MTNKRTPDMRHIAIQCNTNVNIYGNTNSKHETSFISKYFKNVNENENVTMDL